MLRLAEIWNNNPHQDWQMLVHFPHLQNNSWFIFLICRTIRDEGGHRSLNGGHQESRWTESGGSLTFSHFLSFSGMQSLDVDLVGSISGCGRGCVRTNTMDLCFPLSGLEKHSAYVALSKTYFVVVRLHYTRELERIRVVIPVGHSEVLGCMNKLRAAGCHPLQTG